MENTLGRGEIYMADPGTTEGVTPPVPPAPEIPPPPERTPTRADAPAEGSERPEKPAVERVSPEERRIQQVADQIKEVFNDPDIKKQLESEKPDFRKLDKLKEFIKEHTDPSSRLYSDIVETMISDKITGINMSNESKKLLFEWMVEGIIGLPEKGSPEEHYEVGSFQARDNLTTLKSMAASKFDSEFGLYIATLIGEREMAHEFRRNLSQQDAYKEFLAKGLKAHGLDFMRNEIAGVKDVVTLYETFTALKVAERKEWLNQGDIADIDKTVTGVIEAMMEKGSLQKNDRPLNDWETERALAIGKTLFAGTQRFAMYSSLGQLPPGYADRVGSLPYEYIVRNLATFKVTGVRYFNTGGPGHFLKKIIENLKHDKNAATDNPLFGIDKDAWILNGIGAIDVESQPWRSQLLFLGDISVSVEGRETNLLEYLDNQYRLAASEAGIEYDPALSGLTEGTEEQKHKAAEIYTERVQDVILGNRLYLSALIKHGSGGGLDLVTDSMKRKLWAKRAIFDPLGISALRPEMLSGMSSEQKRTWEGMREKMGVANIIRLEQEGNAYFDFSEKDAHGHVKRNTRVLEGDLLDEAKAFKNSLVTETVEEHGKKKLRIRDVAEDYKYQILRKYFGEEYGNQLSSEEEAVLKNVIDRAIGASNVVADAKLPFNFLINDAPHVAWEKTGEGYGGLGDENLFRILLSDQGNLVAGFGEMNGLVENPTAGSAGRFIKAVEAISLVHGREGAQKRMEPFIRAWLEMAETYPHSEWTGHLERFLRRPTSDMEKYWENSNISYDANDRAAYLDNLAGNMAISSNIDKGADKSQLEILKKKMKADRGERRKKSLERAAILLLYLFPIEFVKAIFPKEITEGLTKGGGGGGGSRH